MRVPSQYGFGGFSSSAYYLFGLTNDGFYPPGVQGAQWGWFAGVAPSANSISNLGPRAIQKYSNVTNPNRLTATGPDSRVIAFDGRWGKSRLAFTVFGTQQIFGPPSNQPLPT